jgi:hypothetical protein
MPELRRIRKRRPAMLTERSLARQTFQKLDRNRSHLDGPRAMTQMYKRIVTLLLSFLLSSSLALAQNQDSGETRPVQRQIKGQSIFSAELPAAELTFKTDYKYLGGQIVNLYGNAEAEQHLFVRTSKSGPVESFYWIQFEHFLPTNKYTYDYPADRTADFGALRFIYDVKSFSDYDLMQAEDPASDGAAIRKLLAQHNLAFPKKAARVRMFHLPTADRRTELMIIYGEALGRSSKVPVSKDGVALDAAAPDAAKILLEHAQEDLRIQKP